jgi:hypothetical protein
MLQSEGKLKWHEEPTIKICSLIGVSRSITLWIKLLPSIMAKALSAPSRELFPPARTMEVTINILGKGGFSLLSRRP